VRNDSATTVQGVPLGMSKIRPEYLAPDLSAAHVFLREEPEEEDDGEKDGDDNDDDDDNEDNNNDGDDDGYSP